ncbi:hypothetical protein ACSBR2_012393 [Camellia fascicularis]
MIKIQDEHCSQHGVVPITLEELSVKVFKRRSGYVKRLGLRPSFSFKTTSASANSDYVRRLEMEIQEQNEEIQSQKEEITAQQHEIHAQKEEIHAQNNVIAKMNELSEEHLEMTSSIMAFLRSKVSNENLEDEASHELVDRPFDKSHLFYLFIFLMLVNIY